MSNKQHKFSRQMLILDKPYVSKFLENTILEMGLAVLKNESIKEFKLNHNIHFLEDEEFINEIEEEPGKSVV